MILITSLVEIGKFEIIITYVAWSTAHTSPAPLSKHYLFLASSSFLTHLLDIAHIELKKSAKGVSIVIQSLLDLALTREDGTFRKDVRVSLASSGLYEWLLKIIRVSGMIGSEKGEGVPDEEAKKDRDQEKHGKKPMLAMCVNPLRDHPCSSQTSD
jgi:hypothetical protein